MYRAMPDDMIEAMDAFHGDHWSVVEQALKRTYAKDSKKRLRDRLNRLMEEAGEAKLIADSYTQESCFELVFPTWAKIRHDIDVYAEENGHSDYHMFTMALRQDRIKREHDRWKSRACAEIQPRASSVPARRERPFEPRGARSLVRHLAVYNIHPISAPPASPPPSIATPQNYGDCVTKKLMFAPRTHG